MNARQEAHMSDDNRLSALENSMLHINATLIDLKQDLRRQFDKIDDRFDAIDKKFDAIDKKFENVDTKFDAMNERLDRKLEILHNRLWSNFIWTITMIIGVAGLIAHAQHWI